MLKAESNPNHTVSRAVHLLFAAVIALSFVGFFVGIRQGTTAPVHSPRALVPPEAHPDAVPAMPYEAFDRRRYGPNRQWRSVLTDLDQRKAPPPEVRWQVPGMRESFLKQREGRRAFDGAPPTVPHPVERMTVAECLACHAEARYIGGRVYAPAMSHDEMPNCTQCHIEQRSSTFEPFLFTENSFVGIDPSGPGERVWSGAPPTVPHSLNMRENCLSCHGAAGAHPIRVEHPWDAACLQCHLPVMIHEQRTHPEILRRLKLREPVPNDTDPRER